MATSEMQAAFWCSPDVLELRSTPIPQPTPGTMLVRVKSCTVCGSDVRILKSGNERVQGPRIIGHEIAGDVVELGSGVKHFQIGDRVSVGADLPCGECDYCKRGMPNCCTVNYAMGYQFDGGFAEYVLLPKYAVNDGPVQKFSKDLSYDVAALAEPLACCINGYEVGLMAPGKRVVIFGAGPIGIMLTLMAKALEAAQVILIDPQQRRLDLAKVLAYDVPLTTLCPEGVDVVKMVKDLTNGHGADLVLTACPVVETHEQGIQMLAKRGVINFFGGLAKNARPLNLHSNTVHYSEIYLTGSHGSTPTQHRKALELLESGKIDGARLITHHFPLAQIHEGFKTAQSQEGLKVVIHP